MRRREPGPATELEALDPLTGESLGARAAAAPRSAPTGGRDGRRRGVRQPQTLRRVAASCAAIAVGCALAAAYFGASIVHLRGVERTWRSAMALDAARVQADGRVRALLEEVTTDAADDQVLVPLEAIGTEVASGLGRHERSLADRRIVDSKVSDLRDAMVAALEFRRFQLTPTRNRIGDTPLQLVEADLDAQLDRWNLASSRVDEPRLRSLDRVIERLRTYADVETGTILFALRGRSLHVVDVDGSVTVERMVPEPGKLVAVDRGVAVADGRQVTIYPLDVSAAPLAVVDGATALSSGDPSSLWIVQAGGRSVRRFRVDGAASGWAGDPVPLPPGRSVVGATTDDLVLESGGGGLDLWSPTTASFTAALAPEGARLLDARGPLVLWQGPLPNGRGLSDFLHRYDAGTGRRDLIGLPRTDAASAALSSEGVAAISSGPLAGRLGALLLLGRDSVALAGGGGPRSSVAPQSIGWSDDGASVFWLTPDGAIALAAHADPPVRHVLRTGLDGLERLVVMGR